MRTFNYEDKREINSKTQWYESDKGNNTSVVKQLQFCGKVSLMSW